MKRDYKKPAVEIIEFTLNNTIMSGEDGGGFGDSDVTVSGEGVEDW